jgi:hypothetical protein
MKIRTPSRTVISATALALVLSTNGTVAMADPVEPQAPAQVSCIYLPGVLSGIETRGLFKVESESRLERGPYFSEREDAEGTYFRAPPGGVYLGTPKDKPARGARLLNNDGGIFVPRDPSAAPQLYVYTSDIGSSAATLVPSAAADCSNTRYVRDPVTKAVSVTGYEGGGTETSAKEGVGGPGVLGHLLGKLLVDTGKIAKFPLPKNAEFIAKLSQLVRTAVPMKAADAPN